MTYRLLLLSLLALPVAAQPGREALPDQSVWVRVQEAHFRHTGEAAPGERSDFDAPLVGVGYARGGLQAEIAFGRATAPVGRVRVFDAEVSLGDRLPLGRPIGRLQLDVPLRLNFSYRRVRAAADRAVSEFAVQTLGLNAGLGARIRVRQTHLAVSASGGAGLATRSFDGTPGYGLLGRAEAEARTRLNRRFGLVAGYRLHAQTWDLGRGFLGSLQRAALYDYRGHSHGLHVGLLF